jgi:membrane protease YdiL (CAAX protease family)
MNHLEASFTGKNNFWRYVVMFAAVLVVSNTIGAVPLIIAYALRSVSDPSVITSLASNPNDFSVLGLNPNVELFMMLFPFLAGLLAFILLIRPLNGRSLKITVNGTRQIRWNRVLISGGIWMLISAAYLFVYMKADPTNFRLENTSASLVLLIVLTFALIPFQAAFEETLFRGYLMQGFTVLAKNRWVPVIMTSVLFGLMHAFNPEVKEFGFTDMMAQYILFGLIFGIITIMDDGIEVSTGAHAANNIFLCIMVTNRSSALQTPAVYEQINVYQWVEFTGLLVSGIIFIVILKAVFKWKSFSVLFARVEAGKEGDQNPYTDVLSSVR